MAATQSDDDSTGKSSKDFWKIFGPAVGISVLAFLAAFLLMKPAPPRRIVIATGSQAGAYYEVATRYAERLSDEGITLEVRETSGSVENLELLEAQSGGAHVALVQGGITSDSESVVSLGNIYYEPLWIFVQASAEVEDARLSSLTGKRLAIGAPGSGTRDLVLELLRENGVERPKTTLLELEATKGTEALLAGDVDAAFVVAGYDAPLVQRLLTDERVRPLSLSRAEAYTRRHHFLGQVVLPQGTLDLERNIPSEDISLIAPVANIVARDDIHPALVVLLLEAATEVHGGGGILEPPGEFPSSRHVSIELQSDARHYLESGPPFLMRFLPFWAAIFVERTVIFLIPLLTIFIPLFKILPPTYRWRVRSRIYRWYRDLMTTERAAAALSDSRQLGKHIEDLERIRLEIGQIKVPLSYADELYDLHVHVELVRERLTAQLNVEDPDAPRRRSPSGDPGGTDRGRVT